MDFDVLPSSGHPHGIKHDFRFHVDAKFSSKVLQAYGPSTTASANYTEFRSVFVQVGGEGRGESHWTGKPGSILPLGQQEASHTSTSRMVGSSSMET